MSKVVPEGWSIRKLDGKIKILSGFPFKSEFFTNDPEYMGIIRIRDLDKQNLETFYTDDFEEQYVVTKGDVLIGMDGDFNIVKWKSADALLNQRVCKIKAKDNSGFDTDFLFQSLKEDLLKIHATTGATTVKHLSVKDIRGIEKAYPPLPEQQKIATILSSVDNVIEKTRTHIDKLKDLKTGMMQELLTKGIGHTEYKDTPIGRIPKSWQLCLLEDVAKIQTGVAKNSKLAGDMIEVPYLRVANVQDGYLDLTEVKTLQLEQSRLERFMLQDEDVLVNEGGDFDKLGRGFIWRNQISPCVHQNHVFVVRTKQSKLLPMFFNYLSGSQHGKQYYLGCAKQTTNLASLNSSQLRKFPVILPSVEEQKIICEIIGSIDIVLQRLGNKYSYTEAKKKALMQGLISGSIRL